MRALYVSLTHDIAPGETVNDIHDRAVGEWNISPVEASTADLLVPVKDGRPMGVAWRIRTAFHGVGTGPQGEAHASIVTMGKPLMTAGLLPDEVPALPHGVAIVDVTLAA
jgi:hypothetical protein